MRRESLKILEPCSADWERMDGDGVARFCRLCNKHVHDLSAMTEQEARALLSSGGDRPCVRYLFDDRGQVLFSQREGVGLLPRLAAAAALTFGGLVAGGCMGKMSPPDEPCQVPDKAAPAEPAPVEPAPAEPAPVEPAPAPIEPAR